MLQQDKELYEFSRFCLDVSERLLWRDGKRVSLTDKAFDTLCILVRRGGELVGKDELMNEVWGDSIVEENNLDQKISMLRQALGERGGKGKEKFIETVRGHGYRFLPEVRRVEEQSPESKAQSPKFRVQSPESEIQNPKPEIQNSDKTPRSGNVIALAKWRHELSEVESQVELNVSDDKSPNENQSQKTKDQNYKIPLALFAGIIAVGLGFAVFYYFTRGNFSNNQTSDVPIDSIAILPFENAVQDANAEYLSDGITESLINRLSQLSNLKVMSSSSVFRYKGKEQDTNKIGNELNVRAVLTGSVKQIGDQLIINVRLDDAQNNRQIWGEQYIRKFADILDVQNEIAQEVSTNLRLKLTGADERQIAKRYTENAEAYQLYLKGQYVWNKHTREDLQKAIEYFNQALEKDPNYALAYAGLTNSYNILGNSYLPPREAFPKAKIYAAKALAIDDNLSEAHTAMGAVRLFYDWDFAEAEKELKRAIMLDANNAGAHQLYGDLLEITERFDAARTERKRSLELDPLSPINNVVAGTTFYFARQDAEAITQLEKTINLEPRFVLAYLYLGQTYEKQKMYEQAIATFQKGMTQVERHPQLVAAIGHAYALSGKPDEANKALAELREMSGQRYVSPYQFAVVYAGLGDKEQTFAWLEKAFQDRSFFLIWLKVEPLFDSLRDDPRFADLLRRIGL